MNSLQTRARKMSGSADRIEVETENTGMSPEKHHFHQFREVRTRVQQ